MRLSKLFVWKSGNLCSQEIVSASLHVLTLKIHSASLVQTKGSLSA